MAASKVIIARTIVTGITSHLRTRLSEWIISSVLGVFAYRLLAPGDTFDSSPSYAYMASVMTEAHWGELLAAVAGFRLFALAVNGSWKPFKPYSPTVRSVTALFSAMAWYLLAYGFYQANPLATGWSTYGVLFGADIYLAIVIAGDAGAAWRGHKHGHT